LDATTIGAVLALAGVLSGSVVAYLGKRGENALTDNLQEERDRLDGKVTTLHRELAEAASLRADDQAEIARLRNVITELGGHP
jgi:hypothetical protein